MRDRTLINILWWSAISIALAVQALVLIVFIFSFIPITQSPLIQELFLRHQPLVLPEREMLFFRLFIVFSALIQGAGLFILRRKLDSDMLTPALKRFAAIEWVWVTLQIFCVFKVFVYDNAGWARGLLWIGLIVPIAAKIFWSEFVHWLGLIKIPTRVMDIGMPIVIALIIFIPDMNGLLAKMFMTDHFHHFDTMITAPAWAHLKGAVLNVDQFTHYAIGLPVVLGRLAQLCGGFSYEHLVGILMYGTIIYYIAAYFFLRTWLNCALISGAAVLLAIKWQMFHPGVAPIIFNYPSATVMRYPLDIAFFFLLLAHIRRGDAIYVMGMAVICGFSVFYMIDSGVYLICAFLVYLGWDVLNAWRNKHAVRPVLLGAGGLATVIFVVLVICLFITQGNYLWSGLFWTNMAERTSLFLMGHGNLPMYKSLIEGKYLECAMGFLIPLVYVAVLITTAALIWLRRIDARHILLVVLCVYGLGLYHYYVMRSADTSYYVVAWPFVFILAFGLHVVTKMYASRSALITASAFALSVFALVTNHFFLNYPNIVHGSRNPYTQPLVMQKISDGRSFFNHNDVVWPDQLKLPANSLGETDEELYIEKDFTDDTALKKYFVQEFDFAQDAAIITQLTTKEEKVPLISSFETKILMQADRRPFFYYFPLVDSRPMHVRMFDMTALWTKGRLRTTMQELTTQKPPYVFVEKVLMADKVPQQYEFLYPDLLVVLNYLHRDYAPYAQGKFLMALRRKDAPAVK